MTQMMIRLNEFVWLWNHTLNLNFPRHHRGICKFLERIWTGPRRGLLMAFRASGK